MPAENSRKWIVASAAAALTIAAAWPAYRMLIGPEAHDTTALIALPVIGMSLPNVLTALGPTAFFGTTCYERIAINADIAVDETPYHLMAFVTSTDNRIDTIEIQGAPVRVETRDQCAQRTDTQLEGLLATMAAGPEQPGSSLMVWKDFQGAGQFMTRQANGRVSTAPDQFSAPQHVDADGISTPLPLTLEGT